MVNILMDYHKETEYLDGRIMKSIWDNGLMEKRLQY